MDKNVDSELKLHKTVVTLKGEFNFYFEISINSTYSIRNVHKRI